MRLSVVLLSCLLAAPALAQTLREPPAQQQAFLEVVSQFRERYRAAPNDMARGAERPARAAALCQAVRGGLVRDWIGTVAALSSTSDGRGAFTIRLEHGVTLSTWTNSFSDGADATLIPPGTALFQSAVALSPGQRVVFSGEFIRNRDDCFRETSLSVAGGMHSPRFIFRFKGVASNP